MVIRICCLPTILPQSSEDLYEDSAVLLFFPIEMSQITIHYIIIPMFIFILN